ncbi:MAG: hypothetical protein COS96_02960 [Candidatus Nealsonbacteria bacterium CG07_land_8_20_14_0_80_39_13]|nr:MAG: hypothetical protein COS96_02960 [Candidatus Nealsonbacteria bacterium CG07_land_8_20_14_0_80_39_13]
MIAEKMNRQKDPLWKKLLSSLFIAVLIIVAIIYLTFSIINIKKERANIGAELDALKSQAQSAEKKNEELKSGISEKQTEEYWEGKAREEGYKKPGEEVVIVVPSEAGKNNEKIEEKNIWQKFLEKIGL